MNLFGCVLVAKTRMTQVIVIIVRILANVTRVVHDEENISPRLLGREKTRYNQLPAWIEEFR